MDAASPSAELGKVRRPVAVILDCNYLSFRVVGGSFYSHRLALRGGFGAAAIAFGLWRLRSIKFWSFTGVVSWSSSAKGISRFASEFSDGDLFCGCQKSPKMLLFRSSEP